MRCLGMIIFRSAWKAIVPHLTTLFQHYRHRLLGKPTSAPRTTGHAAPEASVWAQRSGVSSALPCGNSWQAAS